MLNVRFLLFSLSTKVPVVESTNSLPQTDAEINELRAEALRALGDALLRIRESASLCPEHAMAMADTVHNIPEALALNSRVDNQYLQAVIEEAKKLLADRSWIGGVRAPADQNVRNFNFNFAKAALVAWMVLGLSLLAAGFAFRESIAMLIKGGCS